ncbi:hypothetical protein FJU08_19735 [Martelella alba]|uniref:Sel1 repeat family protein n=1 Tax=Martelella alba TaxID=2590451 RepID=A0A506U544_9HYPH|nr:hypothetical protein [Martelella alba]TPW27669.1 hypothetical protein FJU08_19735 [Martelella alba]
MPMPMPMIVLVLSLACCTFAHPRSAEAASAHLIEVANPYSNPTLRDIRKRLGAHQSVSSGELRLLAGHGDSLAAFTLAEKLVSSGKPSVKGEAAYYYAVAALNGRAYAIKPLVVILRAPAVTYGPGQLDYIETALLRQAHAGSPDAILALVSLYQLGRPFGAKPDEAEDLLRSNRLNRFDGGEALQLAVNIASSGTPDAVELGLLRYYLLVASRSQEPGTRAAAQNLLRAYSDLRP